MKDEITLTNPEILTLDSTYREFLSGISRNTLIQIEQDLYSRQGKLSEKICNFKTLLPEPFLKFDKSCHFRQYVTILHILISPSNN